MKYYTLFLFSIILQLTSLYSQSSIKLNFINKKNAQPIENINVYIAEKKQYKIADEFGAIYLNKNKSEYTLILTHPGYKTKTYNLYIIDSVNNYTIELETSKISLETITLTSQKNKNTNHISAVDILLKPVNTSQDILKIIPGLFIAQHAGGGKAEQIFLRGFDIDHGTDINITVDGIPVNMISHAHGQGYADLHFLIPEIIEKVNFDKGPYLAEAGNLATAGFVAFKTKEFIDNNSIKIEKGMFNTIRVNSILKLYNNKNKKINEQLYISNEYFKSDGFYESKQAFLRKNITTKYTAVKNKSKLNILLSLFDSKWKASGQIPLRAVKDGLINHFGAIDNSEGGNTNRTNFTILLKNKLQNNWVLSQQAYFINYNFNLFSNFTFFLNNPISGDMINQKENRNTYGYSSKLKKEGKWLGKNNLFEISIGSRFDDIKNIELSNSPKRVFESYIQQGSIRELNTFAFVNNTLNVNNNISINTNIRYDYFEFGYKNKLLSATKFEKQNSQVVSPKMSINYKPNQKVVLSLNNGIGFHSNDTRVILKRDNLKILPKVFGSDFTVELKPSNNLYIKTALWHLFSEQEFVYVGDAGIVEPSGKSRRLGIDLSVRHEIKNWLFADFDVNISKARAIEEMKGLDYIPLAPSFTSTGGLTAKFKNNLNTSFRYRYIGNRPANEDYSVIAKGYFLIDYNLNYNYKKIDYGIAIENILNIKWREAQFDTESQLLSETFSTSEIHYTPGTPFNLKASIKINF